MKYSKEELLNYYISGKIRFGVSSIHPSGTLEDVNRCIEEVYNRFNWGGRQCYRRRGHGYRGLFCKQHAKEYDKLFKEDK